jgi:uncharacterized protein (DUF362 family)/NAD-dependent dihydropyrimidine dehydrogenase PreA subunit
MTTKVYIVRCPDYDKVGEKMEELLTMMGGMSQFVKSGENIVLKPNLLTAAKPEKAVTTHPELVTAAGRLVKQAGADVILIDSPGSGYPHSKKTLNRVYRRCGMYEAAEQGGFEASLDTSYQAVSFPEGRLIKRFEVMTPIVEADGVLNLCKLKTHGFLSMTGAVKNCFGVIPGLTKPGYHAKLPDPAHFAAMCLDLSTYVSPRLSIMDAVIGMEGNGPHNGSPRHIGLLLASTNPLAIDIVASEIMGLKRENNPVLLEAERRGLTPNRLEHVEVIGAALDDVRIADFKLPSTILGGLGSVVLSLLGPLFKSGFTVKPQIIPEKCVACGFCRDACPVQVISIEDKHARINNNGCIRCYCCHEMCPHDAIELKQGVLYRIFNR